LTERRPDAGAFLGTQAVRFAHVDPAGIVFYPRYFELIDAAVEDWTEAVLGVARRRLHQELGLGLPILELRANFERPSRLGEQLTFVVQVLELRRATARLSIAVRCEDEPRVSAEMTIALVTLATMRTCAWPDAWRAMLLAVSVNSGATS
jgi:4-hydroxybenzoyl-CoA thioesterase